MKKEQKKKETYQRPRIVSEKLDMLAFAVSPPLPPPPPPSPPGGP